MMKKKFVKQNAEVDKKINLSHDKGQGVRGHFLKGHDRKYQIRGYPRKSSDHDKEAGGYS